MSRTTSLDVIRVQQPCHESWESMTGDAKTRFCAGCQRHVHNLSAMPREEAERLICQSVGRLCVRFEAGADGAPVTLEYQRRGRIRGGWKLWTIVGTLGACITGAVQALVREKPAPPPLQTPAALGRMVMGDVAISPPPPSPPTTRPILMGEICPITPPPAQQQPPVGVPVANAPMSL